MSLRSQVTFGFKQATVALIVVRITKIITMIVLARLLNPEIFGIFAMANTTIITITTLREIGFGAAYIQRIDADEKDSKNAIDTVFTIGLVVDLLILVALVYGAPVIAAFFGSKDLINVLRFMAILFLIEPVLGICSAILVKRLEFGKLAAADIIEVFTFSVVAITLAVMEFKIWGIICGIIISKSGYCILLIKFSAWKPNLKFDTKIARELFGFGKFMWAFGALSAVGGALDRVVIGKYWGAVNLGYYHLAFNLCSLPASAFSMLINKITFPAFSKLQKNPEKMKEALLKILSNVSIIVIPASFGLMVTADELIVTVLGQQWKASIPLVRILSIYGLTLSISAITGPAFQALGKPYVLFYTSINHHIIMFALLFLLRKYGVIGICYAVLIPLIISSIIAFFLIVRYLDIRFKDLISAVSMPVILSITMYGVIEGLRYGSAMITNIETEFMLVINVLAGIATYLILSILLNKKMLYEFKDSALEIIKSKKVLHQ